MTGSTVFDIGTVLQGKELEKFLLSGIEEKEELIITHLSNFDGNELFHQWLYFIRCIDEFINLKFVLSEAEIGLLEKCGIDLTNNKLEFVVAMSMVRLRFGNDVFERIKRLSIMLAGIRLSYKASGVTGLNFSTLNEAIDFCQSRRLYYVAYLSLIRLYAKGRQRVPYMELLCHFQYQIDFNMTTITGAMHSKKVIRCMVRVKRDYTKWVHQNHIPYKTLLPAKSFPVAVLFLLQFYFVHRLLLN